MLILISPGVSLSLSLSSQCPWPPLSPLGWKGAHDDRRTLGRAPARWEPTLFRQLPPRKFSSQSNGLRSKTSRRLMCFEAVLARV